MRTNKLQYVNAVQHKSQQTIKSKVCDKIAEDLGGSVVMDVHSPCFRLWINFWSLIRETVTMGEVSTLMKQTIASTVSKINNCPFCLRQHSATLAKIYHEDAVYAIIQAEDQSEKLIQDPQILSVLNWTLANYTPDSEILHNPPFSKQEAPEMIGTAVLFHYTNRMVNIFIKESYAKADSLIKFKFFLRRQNLKEHIKRLLEKILFTDTDHTPIKQKQPGFSLKFLPQADLPNDLGWAKENSNVAKSFASFAKIVEDLGKEILSPEVRNFAYNYIQTWNGENPGLSRFWVEEAIQELPEKCKPTARLILLTALASYQVDQEVIKAFRIQHSGDRELVGATAWASFTAARRISTWLHVPAE